MFRISKRFEFDAAHRLFGYDGLCSNLHGHRYVAEVFVDSSELDNQGMVVDFGVLNSGVGKWIDINWDHSVLIDREDKDVIFFLEKLGFNYYPMANPTAENMAMELFGQASIIIGNNGLMVSLVRIWETPNSYAEVDR